MTSAGSILDMIVKIRNNRSLQKKPRYFHEHKKDLHIHTKIPYLDTEATPEQLGEIRTELAHQKKKNRVVAVVVFIISVAIACLVVKFFVLDILLSYFTE